MDYREIEIEIQIERERERRDDRDRDDRDRYRDRDRNRDRDIDPCLTLAHWICNSGCTPYLGEYTKKTKPTIAHVSLCPINSDKPILSHTIYFGCHIKVSYRWLSLF